MADPNSPESNPQGLDLSSPSVQFDTNAGQWVDMSKPVQGGGYIQKTPLVTDVQFLPDYDEKKYEELGVAGTYTPETAENIPETQMVDIAGGKQIPLKQWVAMSPMERLMTRGDISAMQGLGAGSPKFAIESSPLMQKMVNAGLETLDTGEKVYKYDYSRLPENERQVMKSQGLEGWKNTFTVETGYIDPYTNQPERVRRELWDTLDETDKQRIRESGYEAVIGGGELFPADFKASNVLLDTGEWVSKDLWDSLDDIQKDFLKNYGVRAFNREYEGKVDIDTIKMVINELGGNYEYYNSLPDEESKQIYLTQLQSTKQMDYEEQQSLINAIAPYNGDLTKITKEDIENNPLILSAIERYYTDYDTSRIGKDVIYADRTPLLGYNGEIPTKDKPLSVGYSYNEIQALIMPLLTGGTIDTTKPIVFEPSMILNTPETISKPELML